MTKNVELNGITQALESRKTVIEVFLIATVLSIGVNLVSTFFDHHASEYRIYIGLILVTVVFIYLVHRLIKSRTKSVLIDAMISIDKNANMILKVPSYDFSRELSETLQAGFIENEALKIQWDDEPLTPFTSQASSNVLSINQKKNISDSNPEDLPVQYFSNTVKKFDSKDLESLSQSKKLLIEAVEFVILERLSTHLSDHFTNEVKNKNDDAKINSPIIEFTINDVAKLSLSNRFLTQLCTAIENRPIFKKLPKQTLEEGETLSGVRGTDGSIYKFFTLVLPKESKLKRLKDNSIKLDNGRITICIKIMFNGFDLLIPSGFSECYLGKKSSQIKIMKLNIQIDTHVKLLSLLTFEKWNYYIWMESFINNLYTRFSFSHFLHRINWETVSTTLHVEQNLKKINSRKTPNNQ